MDTESAVCDSGVNCTVEIRVGFGITIAVGLLSASAIAQPSNQNPLDPSGFPLNRVRDERLPPPMPREAASYEFKLISAEESEFHANSVTGKKMVFEYRGYLGQGDELHGDLDTDEFVIRGNVNLLGQGSVVRGESVYINFKSRTYRVVNGEIDIRKALTEGRTLSDLYLRSRMTYGDDERIDAEDADLTSCDFGDPHFRFESRELHFEPNRKVTFRQFRLRILDRTVFSIPSLTIPLNRTSGSYFPDIGQSADEGVYIKLRYGFPVKDDSAALIAQLRSKAGYSLGAEFESERQQRRSLLRVLADYDPANNQLGLTGSIDHRQKLNFGNLRISHSSRQFSYLSGPEIVSHASSAEFTPFQSASGHTIVALQRSETLTGGFRNLQSSLLLSDSRRWTEKLRTNFRLSYSDFHASQSGSTLSSRRGVDVRFTSLFDEAKYSAQIDYQKSFPIGTTENFASGVYKTPELSLRSDTKRLYGDRFPFNVQMAAFVGHYIDNFNQTEITRYAVDFRTHSVARNREGFSLDYDLGFRQGMYSDDTAQYTPRANVRIGYGFENSLSANLRYNYSRMYGFTPLSVDRAGEYNLASFDLMAEPLRGFKFGGQAGFDFRRQDQGRVAWTSPSLRLEYSPAQSLMGRAQAIYDTENSEWSSVRLDFRWKPGETTIAAAAVYDARRNSWGRVNFFFDALRWGRLSLSVLGTYNGYLKRLDSAHLSLTYDLHCTEAILQIIDNRTGFRPGTEVLFFIRIKALPFSTPFGIGRQGESLGGGGGGIG